MQWWNVAKCSEVKCSWVKCGVVWWSVAECCSVVMVLVICYQTLLEDLWTIWSCCSYVFYYYHISSYSLGSIFFLSMYMILFLFNNVIYVFLLLWLCILIVCLCMASLTEVCTHFFLSCKANARVNPAKTGHGPHSSKMFVLFTYCLFCVVLCIVCMYMCTVLLPPGGYPIAVKYIISYHIIYHLQIVTVPINAQFHYYVFYS
jgi:hypothetical protein